MTVPKPHRPEPHLPPEHPPAGPPSAGPPRADPARPGAWRPPPPYPDGWFPVATRAEVGPGRVVTRRLLGEDVVVYRTRGGRLRAVRPFCPHLGAHLGHGGRVEGEDLVCPFHHFAFGPGGECVRTGYGTPPPRARLTSLECREAVGLIFVWRHARSEPPSWETTAPPRGDFGPSRHAVRTLVAHPQDFMENVVDIGHFTPVHRLAASVVAEPRFEGPRMETTYRLGRTNGKRNALFASAPPTRALVQGLSTFSTETTVPWLGMDVRAWFCVAPVDPVRIALWLSVAVRFPRLRPRGAARALAALTPGPLAWLSTFETDRDVPIWAHSSYLEQPRLAQGDGPITRYRRWARQFYSGWPPGPPPARPDA
ncbi:Rieske 2Fe-2S domain-containing protein [Streptomyces sp. NPDC057702]|uniref:Rieske 2Fe-2S domain-containing protein n=1 Tax=unclassified Streptomyces TaxID=2593676 RepID=UPI0036851E3B